MIVLPRNLSDLSSSAKTIVVARVLEARVEPHPQYKNLNSVLVTLQVLESWKGSPARFMTFRQFIADPRDAADLAGYRPGKSFLLFLNAPSAAGFTSPVGIEQGRFQLSRDKNGVSVAWNGSSETLVANLANDPSSMRLSSASARWLLAREGLHGPIPVDVLRDAVHVYGNKAGTSR